MLNLQSDAVIDAVKAHLAEAHQGRWTACQSCGTNTWQFGPVVAFPLGGAVGASGVVLRGGESLLSATLACANCGHVRLYALRPVLEKMGVVMDG